MDNDLKWLITLTAFGLIMIGLTQYYSDILYGHHWKYVHGMLVLFTMAVMCFDMLYYLDYKERRN